MTRVWRFLDHNVLCLHCWNIGRHFPPADSLRKSWRVARTCLRSNR
jgi:hypothetical protein